MINEKIIEEWYDESSQEEKKEMLGKKALDERLTKITDEDVYVWYKYLPEETKARVRKVYFSVKGLIEVSEK